MKWKKIIKNDMKSIVNRELQEEFNKMGYEYNFQDKERMSTYLFKNGDMLVVLVSALGELDKSIQYMYWVFKEKNKYALPEFNDMDDLFIYMEGREGL